MVNSGKQGFGPYFSAFGLNSERSLRMHFKCGKIRTRITPNTATFCAVKYSRKRVSHAIPTIEETIFEMRGRRIFKSSPEIKISPDQF